MSLVKSKQRVADHGEVFTPAWMVEAMLDLVKGVIEEITSKVLEPACGDGNFLTAVLRRKLAAVELKYGKSEFERGYYALLGLMCIYGIELLPDNIAACRANLLEIFAEYLHLDPSDDLYRAASYVLSVNIIHGNALSMRARTEGCKACLPAIALGNVYPKPKHTCQPIRFARWSPRGKGMYERNDFQLDVIINRSEPLFAHFGAENVFHPDGTCKLTLREIAALAPEVIV
jgi:hypothetical protein